MDLMGDGSGMYATGPGGNAQWGRGAGGHPPGALLGRFGENGAVFLIGESFKGTAKKSTRSMMKFSAC